MLRNLSYISYWLAVTLKKCYGLGLAVILFSGWLAADHVRNDVEGRGGRVGVMLEVWVDLLILYCVIKVHDGRDCVYPSVVYHF